MDALDNGRAILAQEQHLPVVDLIRRFEPQEIDAASDVAARRIPAVPDHGAGPRRTGIIQQCADEPTAELDSRTGLSIVGLFRELVENEGLSIVMTTHDPAMMEIVDHVYALEDGVIV